MIPYLSVSYPVLAVIQDHGIPDELHGEAYHYAHAVKQFIHGELDTIRSKRYEDGCARALDHAKRAGLHPASIEAIWDGQVRAASHFGYLWKEPRKETWEELYALKINDGA